ncbi:MAG: hypothetical protein H6625_06215 [Bdellovibrionaceae bacterium]|nr:hypothetical protein [Pseudobdellovibrionaceae bacterium]
MRFLRVYTGIMVFLTSQALWANLACEKSLIITLDSGPILSFEEAAKTFDKSTFYWELVNYDIIGGKQRKLNLGTIKFAQAKELKSNEIVVVTTRGFFHHFKIQEINPKDKSEEDGRIYSKLFGFAFASFSEPKQLLLSSDQDYIGFLGPGGVLFHSNGEKYELLFSQGMSALHHVKDKVFVHDSDVARYYELDGTMLEKQYEKNDKILAAIPHPTDLSQMIVADGKKLLKINKEDNSKKILLKALQPTQMASLLYSPFALYLSLSNDRMIHLFSVANNYEKVVERELSSPIINLSWSFDDRFLLVQTIYDLFIFDTAKNVWMDLETMKFKNIAQTYWLNNDAYLMTLGESYDDPKNWTITFWDPHSGNYLPEQKILKSESSYIAPFIANHNGSLFSSNFSVYFVTAGGSLYRWGELLNF